MAEQNADGTRVMINPNSYKKPVLVSKGGLQMFSLSTCLKYFSFLNLTFAALGGSTG
jgi:hypothetical protein